ncbi:lactate 2-monooxygenase [Cryobacterium mesophilum]|uniref:Lactate 2-monooxygenase n=1 Tax=Terrimesophilobacter mesophilus TaxID=433647 RepID=A0A4R8V8U6_9MICO|nr:alpha-hydroxy-acid oxidizing protein [Terrimesophilobacter mesophilus]MBB5632017.1 lactate 2-monooxygenase [Terrimesophilobacter mesophilus]TFB78905.1 lactate 2-monooxygenase [Terrimesophilobacter mesophilus]
MTQERSATGFGRETQSTIYRDGASGHRPVVPTSAQALYNAAHAAMSPEAWAYVAGSSGSETTAAANRAALDRWRIVPRVLRNVAVRDLGIDLLGHHYPSPVIAAPVGALGLVHPDADLAVARASAELGIPYIFSNQASKTMEETAAIMGDSPRWFQLYWSSSDDLVASLLRRAEGAGAQAIVITLDTHTLGWRPRDLDLAYLPFIHGIGIAQYTSDPVFRAIVRERAAMPSDGPRPRVTPRAVKTLLDMTRHYPGRMVENLRSGEPRVAVETFLDVFSRPSLTWDELAFARKHTSLPIVLKGIQHPDDARRALAAGVDGIVVSNHGGRQIDGAIGSLDVLPAIVDIVGGRMPVLFDSGIRGGSDILKALALGAAAVLVGRPWVYGLAIAGSAGVREVLRNLVAEFDIALGLSGHTSIAELSRDSLGERP